MNRRWIAVVAAGLAAGGWAATAQEPAAREKAPAKVAAEPGGVRLVAGQRAAAADASHGALGYTSTPVLDVAQPRPDLLTVTMAGAAAVGGLPCEDSAAAIAFDLTQCFTVVDDRPAGTAPRPIRLVLEAQLSGLFRGNRDGAGVASTMPAESAVCAGGVPIAMAGFPARSHTGKEVMLISDRSPAVEAVAAPGEYTLTGKFAIQCAHPKRCFHKNVVMAVFGEVGRTPDWMNLLDPTRDVPRNRDYGFRVAVRVEPLPAGPPRVPASAK